MVLYIYNIHKNVLFTFFTLPYSELILVGLAFDVVD